MRAIDFALDPRLQTDTHYVTSLPLCEVLLMNDARYPWLILAPRRNGLVEILDLPSTAQLQLWQEVSQVAAALREVAPCDKLNIGALGNIVRQLHVHVIARKEGDAAWPGPVWGNGPAEPYREDAMSARIELMREKLAAEAG